MLLRQGHAEPEMQCSRDAAAASSLAHLCMPGMAGVSDLVSELQSGFAICAVRGTSTDGIE